MDKTIAHQIEELLILALECEITESQIQSLNTLIKNDPERIRYTIRFLQIASSLKRSRSVAAMEDLRSADDITPDALMDSLILMAEHERTAPETVVPKVEPPAELIQKVVKPPRQKHKMSKFDKFVLITTAAAALFIFAFVKIGPLLNPPRIEVATLADQADAQWVHLGAGETLKAGDRLRSHEDPFLLNKGTARIKFDYGAEVVIEGPAEFELLDEEKMAIYYGRLYATVPNGATGFTTVTPSATIIDLGTEFGVEVDFDGTTDVHMFKGKASLVSGKAGRKAEAIDLLAGNAKQVNTEGQVRDIKLKERLFVRPTQHEWMHKAENGSAYHRWLLYSNQLRQDPSLVAYYTFDQKADGGAQLLNQSFCTTGKLNGVLGDGDPEKMPTRVPGRWPQKECMRFERKKLQQIVVPHDPLLTMENQISIASWVFLETESSGGHILSKRVILSGQKSDIEYQAALFGGSLGRDSNALQFGAGRIQNGNIDGLNYTPPMDRQVGQWNHFAVTFDGKKISYYLDGEAVLTRPYAETMTPCSEPLRIGTDRPDERDYNYLSNYFDGLMGELAIFKRVISASEVQKMYQAGKPE